MSRNSSWSICEGAGGTSRMFRKLDLDLEARMSMFGELNCVCTALDRSY
jgi:hypothetical protein